MRFAPILSHRHNIRAEARNGYDGAYLRKTKKPHFRRVQKIHTDQGALEPFMTVGGGGVYLRTERPAQEIKKRSKNELERKRQTDLGTER